MAYDSTHSISYVGAEDVSEMSDSELWQKYKQDAGFYAPTDVFNLNEAAEGFHGWQLDRTDGATVRYTASWNTQEDYDAFLVAVQAAGYADLATLQASLSDWDIIPE